MGLKQIHRIEVPFRQWSVNAWLVEIEGAPILFDTGFGSSDVLNAISPVIPGAVCITHDHPDHVGGLSAFKGDAVRTISEVEAIQLRDFDLGGSRLRVADLSGHKSPAVGYVFELSGVQVLVAGDALFAGSMGGCHSRKSYRLAFETLNNAIRDLPDDCVVLPGHGPATTLGEEKIHNPFNKLFR